MKKKKKNLAWFKERAKTDTSPVYLTDEELSALRNEAMNAAAPQRWIPNNVSALASKPPAPGQVGECSGIPLFRLPRGIRR